MGVTGGHLHLLFVNTYRIQVGDPNAETPYILRGRVPTPSLDATSSLPSALMWCAAAPYHNHRPHLRCWWAGDPHCLTYRTFRGRRIGVTDARRPRRGCSSWKWPTSDKRLHNYQIWGACHRYGGSIPEALITVVASYVQWCTY